MTLDPSAIKEWLAEAYRESQVPTILCIYAIFIAFAIITHLSIRYISKQAEIRQPASTGPNPVPSIVTQQSIDSDCSNIVAGNDANVDCPSTGKDNDKKKAPPQH
jgi:hypothetical protein